LFHFVLDGTDGVSVAGTVEPGTVGQASPPPTIMILSEDRARHSPLI
jgi:hypothetical protein